MKVLVALASKHGATDAIGKAIADVIRDAGLEVGCHVPSDVATLDGYDAVILGSAVYAGRWLKAARTFADRHAIALTERPVWLVSSGPIGDPPKPEGDLPEVEALAARIGAQGHRSFAGRLDRRSLGFFERTIVSALRAPDGDFRPWSSIRAWADAIAAQLTQKEVPA